MGSYLVPVLARSGEALEGSESTRYRSDIRLPSEILTRPQNCGVVERVLQCDTRPTRLYRCFRVSPDTGGFLLLPSLPLTPRPSAQARNEALAAAAAKRRYLDLARAMQVGDAYADVSPAALRAELARTKDALAAALGQAPAPSQHQPGAAAPSATSSAE